MPGHMTVSGAESIFEGKKKPTGMNHRAFPKVNPQQVVEIAKDIAMKKMVKDFRSKNG